MTLIVKLLILNLLVRSNNTLLQHDSSLPSQISRHSPPFGGANAPRLFFTEFKQFAITSMVAIFNIDIFIMRIVHVQVEFTKTMF